MKEGMKKRAAVFLSVLMVLPAILGILPMTALEAQAANNNISVSWSFDGTYAAKPTISVEAGQKFYIGDYVHGNNHADGSVFTASMVNASYKSSKPSVVTVNKKGYTVTKKTGKSTISVSYKGHKINCVLNVVKKGTFGNKSETTAFRKELNKVIKKMPSKITPKNGFDYIAKNKAFQKATATYETEKSEMIMKAITENGFLKKDDGTGYFKPTTQLAVPQAGRIVTITGMTSDFKFKNDPTSTRSSKCLKISSASATSSQIKIKFKKAPSAEHILAAHLLFPYENETMSKSSANIPIRIFDKKEGKSYFCQVTIKKGNKTGVIKNIKTYDYQAGEEIKVKLVKGRIYEIDSKGTWANAKKVKVK